MAGEDKEEEEEEEEQKKERRNEMDEDSQMRIKGTQSVNNLI